MKIDKVLANEIKKANGDGSREAKFTLLHKIIEVKKELSSPAVREHFSDCFKNNDRAAVAICVAATVLDRKDRLEPSTVSWASEIMKLWTNRTPSTERIIIEDGLHPSRIEEYAGSFIRLTTEEH